MKHLKPFEAIITPSNKHKQSINHIYVDGTNIVATDTRLMLTKAHNWDIVTPFLIINQKATKHQLPTTDIWNELLINNTMISYPNYQYIIPKDDTKINSIINLPLNETIMTALYRLSMDYSVMIDYLDHAVKLNKLNKLLGTIVYVGYTANLVILKTSSGYSLYIIRYTTI